ncbi:MAG: hypothetical protein M0C28_18305 [Candidatus Moduliflexus flocculans]|nr:hypothetical protein [Candidatus Moduliflexus flocculans]
MYGARISLEVALFAALFSLVIGVTYGAIVGHVGRSPRRLDDALRRHHRLDSAASVRHPHHGHRRQQRPRHDRAHARPVLLGRHGPPRPRPGPLASRSRNTCSPRGCSASRSRSSSGGI